MRLYLVPLMATEIIAAGVTLVLSFIPYTTQSESMFEFARPLSQSSLDFPSSTCSVSPKPHFELVSWALISVYECLLLGLSVGAARASIKRSMVLNLDRVLAAFPVTMSWLLGMSVHKSQTILNFSIAAHCYD